ncbi:hypothetical protein LPJ64_002033 [Coemansia asiatica]|uniref:Minor histocompatibility antigen H13 n=1 Tax=Coemansia asiatica TaxID=1052880 RepID=A0A9W7XNU5_9FUNG|nr:hypothetical protein LPJ64_002033 [Coemansia asiatica]
MSDAGLLVAYAAIGTMAVVPIYYGAHATLGRVKSSDAKKHEHEQFPEYSDSEDEEDEETESVSAKDAYMFPVYGSISLFTLYVVFKYVNPEWVNYLLSGYFALLGVGALVYVGERMVKGLTGVKLPLYHLSLVHRKEKQFDVRFTQLHVGLAAVAAVLVGVYLWTKNWVVSNMLGLAFSFWGLYLVRLDSFKAGMIMLAGLFVYDIFWVFGTEVMVSVATKSEVPIKVVFPKALFPADGAFKMTMLGLGDIIVPGVFLSLCLRFDRHQFLSGLGYAKDKPLPAALAGRRRNFAFPTPYFNAGMAAYVAGLATTIAVMHVFKAAQPALLYLSPACILSVVGTALARGELSQVLGYTEEKDNKDKSADKDGAAAASTTSRGRPRKSTDDGGEAVAAEQQSVVVQHRYNLRNQTHGASAGMSGGELADDEQEENAPGESARDETPVGVSSSDDDNGDDNDDVPEPVAASGTRSKKKKPGPKPKGAKTRSKK